MPATLVFSYLAFSTPQQKKGRSSDRQHNAAQAWAKAHKFRVAPERQYCDEGISRFNGKARMKGALSRFLKLCGTAAVPAGSILIIEDFDRLSRENADDAWELFRGILITGVEIVVLSLDRWFKRESLNRFEDRLLVQACQHRAHNESKMKADRQRDIWADRRRRAARGEGIITRLPSWIRRNGAGDMELIPERVETIRLAARLLKTMGTRRVAVELARPGGEHERPCWLERGEWDSECLQQILRRPAVWGAYQPMKLDERRRLVPFGEVVRGHYPAVFSEAEAEAIRRVLTSRRHQRGRRARFDRNVLRYLGRDAETGQYLRLKGNGQPGHDFLDRRHLGRSLVLCHYDVLEAIVLRAVQEWMPDALTPRASGDVRRRIKELQGELAAVAGDRQAIREQLSRPGRAASTAAILAEQLDELDGREREIKERLGDAESNLGGIPPSVLREAQALAEQLPATPEDKQQEARQKLNERLRDVLEGVWVYRRRVTARTGELIVQVWPRAGECKEVRAFLGMPRDDYRPLDTKGADFRKGFPSPLAGRGKRPAAAG